MSDGPSAGRCSVPLHRWESFHDPESGGGIREVEVDVASALSDALLPYNVPAGPVLEEFFRLILNPEYEVD